jgi:hypothetical protein
VAHSCNPSYSGGRDEGDCSSKLVNSSRDPTLKKKRKKRAGGVAQGVGLEFKPQYWKKKKKEKTTAEKPFIGFTVETPGGSTGECCRLTQSQWQTANRIRKWVCQGCLHQS